MTGKGGRPTIATPFGRKVTLSIRTTSGIKAALAAEAEGQGGNLSEEAERRIVASLESDKSLDQAMVLAYGPDNAGLLCLIGEVLRIVTPHGEWLDNDAGFDAAAGGIVRVLRRLRAPGDGTTAESGPDARVDALLWDLGDTGEDHPGQLTARQRWAAEKRRRLGEELSARLKTMREAVREGAPPRDAPEADPEAVAAWGAALKQAQQSE